MIFQNSEDKILEINKKMEILQSLRPIKPEFVTKINEKLKLDVNYHSNKLEGNTLTLGETKSLILHQMSASIAKKIRDVEEMRSHIKAYEELIENTVLTSDQKPMELTEYFIKNLHRMILVEDREDKFVENGLPKSVTIPAGNYKTQPNSVQTKNGIFHYSEPFEVPSLMSDLLIWYNSVRNELNPVILSSLFQYKFLRIHPFGDGNGRMSRFLGNLILQSGGLVITSFKAQERDQYLNALTLTDNNLPNMNQALQSTEISDFEPFINFVATSLLETLDLVIRGAKGEDITEVEDILKKLEIKAKSAKTGYSLQDILNDENLLKEQNEQLQKLGNTIDAYIERVLKHKFWKTFFNKNYHIKQDITKEIDFSGTYFESIFLDSTEMEIAEHSFFIWSFYCGKPVADNIYTCENFNFVIKCIFEIDFVKIVFFENNERINVFQFKFKFKYLDADFETKLRDFIIKLDEEIDQIIKSTIINLTMPF